MTIQSSQIAVGTTPTLLVPDNLFPEEVHIHIALGTIYLGGADVTTSNGFKLDNNTEFMMNNHDNPVYAVTTAGTTTAYLLIISK